MTWWLGCATWRRLARADLDVGEDAGAERHLLPDPDGLGRHALVEVAE